MNAPQQYPPQYIPPQPPQPSLPQQGGQAIGGAPAATLPSSAPIMTTMPNPGAFVLPPDNGANRGVNPASFAASLQQPQQQQPLQQQQYPQQANLPYQFNDGLQLGGPAGGYNPIGQQPQPGVGQQPFQQQMYPSTLPQVLPQQTAPYAAPQQPIQYQPTYQQPVQQQPTQQQPLSTVVRDNLVAQGIPVGHYTSDSDLLNDLGRASSSMTHLRSMANLGYETLTQQGAQPQPQQQQQSQQPDGKPPKPAPPEWRAEWSSQVRYDEDSGRYVAADNYSNPVVVQRANERAAWEQERRSRLTEDPASFVWEEGLGDRISETIRQELSTWSEQAAQQERQRQTQQQVNTFLQQNEPTIFQLGPNGQRVVNPFTGEPALTQVGERLRHYTRDYSQRFQSAYGMPPDPMMAIEHAQLALARDGFTFPGGQPNGQANGQMNGLSTAIPNQFTQQNNQLSFPVPGATNYAGGGLFGPAAGATMSFAGQMPSAFGQDQDELLKNNVVARAAAMNGARYSPSSSGTIVSSAANEAISQNPQLGFQQMLQQAAIAKGLIHPNGY